MDINQLGNIMKEAQKMQQRMEEAQKQLIELVVKGVSGGGLVEIEMNGRHQVLRVKINPSLVKDGDFDLEMIQDLITAAANDAAQRIEKESKAKIADLTAGLNIPTGFIKDQDKE